MWILLLNFAHLYRNGYLFFVLLGRTVNSLNWRWRQKQQQNIFQEERLNTLWRSPAWLVGPGWRGNVWWPTSCPTDRRNQGEKLKMREKYNDVYECRRFFPQSGHAEAGQHPRGGDLLGAAQGRLHQIRSVRQSSNIQNWDILTRLHR